MDCLICANTLNKRERSPVTCFACEYVACKECTRTYLTGSNTLPQCMQCHVRFPMSFLIRKLNRSWVLSQYKDTATQVLTSIEMGKMPETQPYVEAEVERQRLRKVNAKITKEYEELRMRMRRMNMQIQANEYLIRGEVIPEHLLGFVDRDPIVTDTRKQFVMPCPLECRGFLSSQYKCGTCQKSICSDCFVLKELGHECIESNRLSAEMIKRESKGCPKCGARICKIDGCDQMYCTAQTDGVHCNTAFSWRTGKIETGTVHNPHYYELMHKKGVQLRNAGDVQCGGVPDIRAVSRALDAVRRMCEFSSEDHLTMSDLRSNLVRVHRRISEMVQYTTHEFRRKINEHEGTMRRHRVNYMMNRLTKEAFADVVYKTETDYQKNTDLHHILELISISGIETFQGMVRDFPEYIEHEWPEHKPLVYEAVEQVRDRLQQLDHVREYCNDQLKEVSITYHCTVNIMDELFNQVPSKYNLNGNKKS
uniref:RING-type domain-containing protein n=1 Tax=viral metagenome TaxID=1070528 RepID=A0A6C0AIB0_9ZZZZ